MGVAETEELLLTELAAGGDRRDEASGRTLSTLVDALEATSRPLSGGIELATAIEDLRARGLVELADSTDEPSGDATYVLTEAGQRRAAAVRSRLADVPITVVDDGDRCELALAAAADALDRSLVEVAATVTDDGTYYRDDEPAPDRLVDRERERERCETILERVERTRRGAGVFLAGPGGVGKTTLARHLATAARDEFAVLRAACGSESDSFGPVRELLADRESARSPFDDVGATVDDPGTFAAEQTALFHDVTEALAPTGDEQPVLCFVDDCHLADAATLAYVEYLLERLDEYPLVLLATYRPTAIPDDDPFVLAAEEGESDGERGADEAIARVRLSPLDRDGSRDLLEQVVGRRGAPDALVDAVHDRTGGTPLFVEETVSRLLETDQLDPRYEWYPESPDAIDVPEAVTETIERRIADLDADAREILLWAAVVGTRVDVSILRSVADLPASRVRSLLEALVAADVFDRIDDGEAVAFRTEVVRDALLENLTADERRECHATVADALAASDDGSQVDSRESSPGSTLERGTRNSHAEGAGTGVNRGAGTDARAGAIARHRKRAGDDARAVAWYREAGERAMAVYAHEAAIEHYRAALALARDTDDAALLAVAERLASIYVTTGDFDDAERYVSFVRERTETVERRQRLAVIAAQVDDVRGNFERVVDRTDEALALDSTPSETRCRLLNRKTRAHRHRGEFEAASRTARRQRAAAAAIDDDVLESRAILQLGTVDWTTGEYDDARERVETALEGFRAAGEPEDVAKARTILGTIAEARDEYGTARTHYRRALEAYRTVGQRVNVAKLRGNLGSVAYGRSDYEAAREHTTAALERFESVEDRHSAAGCRLNLGNTALERGRYERARDHLETARAETESMGDRALAADARIGLGRLATRRGEYDRASDHLDGALAETTAIGDPRRAVRARVALGELALVRGEGAAAAEPPATALETAEEIGDRRGEAAARRALGELALERGEYGTAEERLATALETFAAIDARHDAARTRRALGELAVARGDVETGRERVRDALETFDDVGATDDALEALGVLVDAALENGDDDRVRELVDRAADRLADFEDEVAYEDHRKWVADARAALERATDSEAEWP